MTRSSGRGRTARAVAQARFRGRGVARSLVGVVVLLGCRSSYRVGEHIWVDNDAGVYPAFVREARGGTRLLVQYQGCDKTWVREVTLDRIKGRIAAETPVSRDRYACLKDAAADGDKVVAASTPFKVGDKVRVRWRGSVYPAVVVTVVAADRFAVHYEGYEAAWDETVSIQRIVGRR
ncbi:MAG: hypothetical protein JW940_18165 [Polyangiaceae bacterium]|nr:hypothetical protein [Polyangiaceae bacterium]